MITREEALAFDDRSRAAFRAWQAEREPGRRAVLKAEYEAAEAEARAAWEAYGPDPLLSDVKRALDQAAARESDPNPDDPDDETP